MTDLQVFDEDYFMVADDPNLGTALVRRVPAPNVANLPTLVTRYGVASGDRVHVPAGAFTSMQGSPALSFSGTGGWTPVWLLDAASDEAIAASVALPSWWQTYDIDVLWMNHSTGTGNVQLAVGLQEAVEGVAVNTIASNVGITRPARTQNLLDVPAVRTGITYSGGPVTFVVIRDADNVADTLANDIAVIGVTFRRVT